MVWEFAVLDPPPGLHFLTLSPNRQDLRALRVGHRRWIEDKYLVEPNTDAPNTNWHLLSCPSKQATLQSHREQGPFIADIIHVLWNAFTNWPAVVRTMALEGTGGCPTHRVMERFRHLSHVSHESKQEIAFCLQKVLRENASWISLNDADKMINVDTDIVCFQMPQDSTWWFGQLGLFGLRGARHRETACFSSVYPQFKHLKRICFVIEGEDAKRWAKDKCVLSEFDHEVFDQLLLHFPSLKDVYFLDENIKLVHPERLDPATVEIIPGWHLQPVPVGSPLHLQPASAGDPLFDFVAVDKADASAWIYEGFYKDTELPWFSCLFDDHEEHGPAQPLDFLTHWDLNGEAAAMTAIYAPRFYDWRSVGRLEEDYQELRDICAHPDDHTPGKVWESREQLPTLEYLRFVHEREKAGKPYPTVKYLAKVDRQVLRGLKSGKN